ncbi:MAG: protein kinase [Proteobacteria bacterium]|nr:protein kinase [Pseudomonadota bacterium]
MKLDISTFSSSSLIPSSSLQRSALAIIEEILNIKWPSPSSQFREMDRADEETQQALQNAYQNYIETPSKETRIHLLQSLQTKIAAVKKDYQHAVTRQQYYIDQAAREAQDIDSVSWGEWLVRGAQRITGYDSLQQQIYYESIAKDRLDKLERLAYDWRQLYEKPINEEHAKNTESEKTESKEDEVIELNTDSAIKIAQSSQHTNRKLLMTPNSEFIVNTDAFYKKETENNEIKQNMYSGKRQLFSSNNTSQSNETHLQFPPIVELSSLNGTNGFKIDGEVNSESGASVSGGEDVNGDGYSDVLISASGNSNNGYIGRYYVLFGGPTINSDNGIFYLENLNGKNGFKIDGVPSSNSLSITTAGDVNKDGYMDLLLGSSSLAYVVFGASNIGNNGSVLLSTLNGTNGFRIDTGLKIDSVSGGGDINADGYADILLANSYGGVIYTYVIFGGSSIAPGGQISIPWSSLNGSIGFEIDGESSSGAGNAAVSIAGDINRDGYADILIGVPYFNGYIGRSYVVFGGPDVGGSGKLLLSSLNGTNGFKLDGEGSQYENYRSGAAVSSAGDINGDNYTDFLIGASGHDYSGGGRTYVIFGGSMVGNGGSLPLSSLNGVNGFKIVIDKGENSEGVVSLAGDINKDGYADILIRGGDVGVGYAVFGGPTVGSNGLLLSYVLNGADGFRFEDETAFSGLGGVSTAGDVNGDGYTDFVVGNYLYNNNFAGRTYVVFSNGKFPYSPPLPPYYSPSHDIYLTFTGIVIVSAVGGAIAVGLLACCFYCACIRKRRAQRREVLEAEALEDSKPAYPLQPIQPVLPSVTPPVYFVPQPTPSIISIPGELTYEQEQKLSSAHNLEPSPRNIPLRSISIASASQSGKLSIESVSDLKMSNRSDITIPAYQLIDEVGEMKISLSIAYKDLEFDEKDKLGAGAYGTVYKGTYKFNEVAIKQLNSQHLSEAALDELKLEAGILGSMRSDYIVELRGICLEAPYYCLVMELMPKGSLYGLLQNSPDLPLSVRYRIGLDVCYGLYHLHEKNILHRDLKSLNVLLDDRLRAKITDFGLSKMKSEMASSSSTQGMKGTLGWMAPELFAEKPQPSAAADIYAFGMVLWEMMVNPYRIPFQGLAPASLITAKLTRGDKQETISESCPPKIAQLMRACWQEQDKRPPAKVLAKSLSALFKASQEQPPLNETKMHDNPIRKVSNNQLTLLQSTSPVVRSSLVTASPSDNLMVNSSLMTVGV